jgi:hypothetical protein
MAYIAALITSCWAFLAQRADERNDRGAGPIESSLVIAALIGAALLLTEAITGQVSDTISSWGS